MPITNGSTVLAADLNGMATTALALVQADNAHLPAGLELHLHFPGLVAATDLTLRRAVFVAPIDLLLESVAVETGNHTAASTSTVKVVSDGALMNGTSDDGRGVSVTGTSATGAIDKFSRLLLDNSRTNVAVDFASTAEAFRVFPAGSTVTVTIETTSVAVTSAAHVVLVFREFWGRL